MLILMEGADGTGKTTLAEELCDHYNLDYVKFSRPDKPTMDYFFEKMVEVKAPALFDRLHLSEEAYAPVYRDGSQLSALDFWTIEGWLWARQCVLIVCSASLETMKENQAKVEDPYHDDRQSLVVDNYSRLLSKTSLPLVIYDYSVEATHGFMTRLVESVPPAPVGTWDTDSLGTAWPKVWLLGAGDENLGPKRSFFKQTTFYSAGGDMLRDTIRMMGRNWSEVRVGNALMENFTRKPLMDEWEALGQPITVALGHTASVALAGDGVPFNEVRHPGLVSVMARSTEAYADELRTAIDR